MLTSTPPALTGSVARWIGVTVVFTNLGIHVALAPDHLAEKPYIGVLFVIGSALLGAVMTGLASDRDRLRVAAWLGGSLVSAVMFLAFLFSRTTGLPLGYHEAWAEAPEDLLGLSALFLELVFLGCAATALTTTPAAGRRGATVRLHDRTAPLD